MEIPKNTYILVPDTFIDMRRIDFSIYNYQPTNVESTIDDIYHDMEPVHGRAIDKRLGTTEYKLKSRTCGETALKCHKLLVYKNENEIFKLLNNKREKQRFAEIRSICKNVTHCQKDN